MIRYEILRRPKVVIAIVIGLMCGAVVGMYKGIWGFHGPIVAVLLAFCGAFVGALLAQVEERSRVRRMFAGLAIGSTVGILYGVFGDKDLGYVIAQAIDWAFLGAASGAFFDEIRSWAVGGIIIGALFGMLLGLFVDDVSLGHIEITGNRFLMVLASTIGMGFTVMALGIWVGLVQGETKPQRQKRNISQSSHEQES